MFCRCGCHDDPGNMCVLDCEMTVNSGIRYRDIIAWKGNTCEIIDTRVWADNFVISEAHSCKVAYYTNPSLINGMRMFNSKS